MIRYRGGVGTDQSNRETVGLPLEANFVEAESGSKAWQIMGFLDAADWPLSWECRAAD